MFRADAVPLLPLPPLGSGLSSAHLLRNFLCDTEWVKSFQNLFCKVSKGICHLTFTGQSGMSELKKLRERNTASVPFKRGERDIRAQPNRAALGCEAVKQVNSAPRVPASHRPHEVILPALTN